MSPTTIGKLLGEGFADVSILGGVYLTGPTPVVSTLLWMVVATAFSFVFARLRLATGSVWPAIALHSAWNAIIQTAFDSASKGTGAELWIGESGILIALTMTLVAVVFSYGKWTLRRSPGELLEPVQQANEGTP